MKTFFHTITDADGTILMREEIRVPDGEVTDKDHEEATDAGVVLMGRDELEGIKDGQIDSGWGADIAREILANVEQEGGK